MCIRDSINTMGDTRAVGDDDRDAGITFGIEESLQRMRILGAISHLGNEDVFVIHRNPRQIFFTIRLAAGSKFSDCAARRRLGILAAGIGINLSIEHQNIDVFASRQHMVKATETNVVSPAVTANDPHDAPVQIFSNRRQLFRARRSEVAQFSEQDGNAFALFVDARFAGLIGIEQRFDQAVTDFQRHPFQLLSLIHI